MTCGKCGHVLGVGMWMCPGCGQRFAQAVPPDPPPAGETASPSAGGFRWELVNDQPLGQLLATETSIRTWRAKVAGGWLVLVTAAVSMNAVVVKTRAMDSALTVTFYPDPDHLWDGTTLP